MVSPVETAIATSEIKEDSNIIAKGHQDSQYGNWSGAAEGIIGDASDMVGDAVNQVTGIKDSVGSLKPSLMAVLDPTTYLSAKYWGAMLGVVVVAGSVNQITVWALSMIPDGGWQTVGGLFSLMGGSAVMLWGLTQPTQLWQFSMVVAGSGIAYQGFRTIWNNTFSRQLGLPSWKSESVTKRSPTGSGHVSPGQSTFGISTSPFSNNPGITRKDVTLAAEVMSGPGAEGDFGGGNALPVNYGQGGVTSIQHDQTFAQATGSLQQRGSNAKNAFVESIMPKTTSYQPQAFYAEDTPTMIQKNAHYTAETKAGIQNVWQTYQAPPTTARRGGSMMPKQITKNANATSISNEMKGTVGMGSVIGQ
jgi:hypothetical protein